MHRQLARLYLLSMYIKGGGQLRETCFRMATTASLAFRCLTAVRFLIGLHLIRCSLRCLKTGIWTSILIGTIFLQIGAHILYPANYEETGTSMKASRAQLDSLLSVALYT